MYEFIWNDFCDWYIEAAKLPLLRQTTRRRTGSSRFSLRCSKSRFASRHPFLPMITEEIYGKLPGADGSVMIKAYPAGNGSRADKAVESKFSSLQELVSAP